MRKLILLRHGQTESYSTDKTDHSRELLLEGIVEADKVGTKLDSIDADLILSSSAMRAGQTAYKVAEKINYPVEDVHIIDELYNPTTITIYEIIRGINDSNTTVIMVGHNPGFTEIANAICGIYDISMATCGYCVIELDCSWDQVDDGVGRLLFYDTP